MNPTQPVKLVWLVVLATFWVIYGLTGRDAWQAEEAETLATVLDALAGTSSIWESPAPLFTAVATLIAGMSPLGLDVQDSARLASGLFSLVSMLLTGLAARALLGKGYGTVAALALMGGFGLMLRAHALLPETALLALWALLLWGMGLARSRPQAGGVAIGVAVSAMTLGLRGVPDLLVAVILLVLPWAFVSWRERQYRKALEIAALVTGVLVVVVGGWLFVGPHWHVWWQYHGFARLIPAFAPVPLLSEAAWFAWPLWPLALAALWHDHRRMGRAHDLQVPLLAAGLLLLAAVLPTWSRLGGLLPMLVPLSLLAALALANLRRGAAQAFYWFGVLCFMFFALAFWTYFFAIEWGVPTQLAGHVSRLTPNYAAGGVSAEAIWLAAGATLLWLLAIPLFPRAQIRPILVWATGMMLTWTVLISLFRPWLEAGWGYRPLVMSLASAMPGDACLTAQTDTAMTTMLRVHLPAQYRATAEGTCAYHLVEARQALEAHSSALPMEGTVIWEGYRPRYKHQVYRLIERPHE